MKTPAKYGAYVESAEYIRRICKMESAPDAAIILGSGLGGYADELADTVVIPYADIPNFPTSTVSYQKGELVYGKIAGKTVLAMNGRFHFYEGWEMWECAYPVGVFKVLGVNTLIVTNASGGINESYRPGDLVAVTDHIKLSPDSPLRGPNIPEFASDRFFDMQNAYSRELRAVAMAVAAEVNIKLRTGVYGYMTGPQYETPTEIRMLRMLGADLVGMSTVPEIIMAAKCGLPALCISCVTNMAAGITGAAITEDEVVETGKLRAESFKALVTGIISKIQRRPRCTNENFV